MNQKNVVDRITIQDLIDHLKCFDRDCELTFGNDDLLTFYRTKGRGDKLVQIEFNQVLTSKSEDVVEVQDLD